MKGKVKLKTLSIFLIVAGVNCDFLDELMASLNKLQDTVDKISLEQIKTNKKVDQLEEKIEELGTKALTVKDLNEVNNNICNIDAIDQLKTEMKSFTLGIGCKEAETDGAIIANEDLDRTNLAEDHIDGPNLVVKVVDEKVILVAGGRSSTQSVEAITTDGTPLCTLPNLPDERYAHTMDNHIMCGGGNTQSSCLHYVAGKWTKYRNDLKFKRTYHVSWRRQDREVILMGGGNGQKTSEVVSSSGHQKGFNLQHEVYSACAIKLDDYFIITGGNPSITTVSKYDKNGLVTDLTSMNTGRRNHACGHYYRDTNELIYLVTGGYNGKNIVSTEVMSSSGSHWKYVGNLPLAVRAPSGISVNNKIFITGGLGVDWVNTILKFNPASNEWEKTGELSFDRAVHAVAVLPLKEVKPFCL